MWYTPIQDDSICWAVNLQSNTTMVHAKLFTHVYERDQFVDAIAVQPQRKDSNSTHPPLVAVAFSVLESNLWGGGVSILNGITGEELSIVRLPTGVSALAWVNADDLPLLAVGCDNGDVQLFVVQQEEDGVTMMSHRPLNAATPSGHDDIVAGLAASVSQPNILASASWDLTVKLWDVTDPTKTLSTLDGHTNLIWDIAASATTPHFWATASQDATVQVWDDRLLTQSPSSTLSTAGFSALSVDWEKTEGHTLAAGLEDGSVMVFDIRTPQSPLKRMVLHEGGVHCVKYSPFQAHVLAVGSDDTHASIITASASPAPVVQKLISKRGIAHGDYVRALDWYSVPSSSHGPRAQLLTGSWDHKVRSWTLAHP